jgi:hypothetical protein
MLFSWFLKLPWCCWCLAKRVTFDHRRFHLSNPQVWLKNGTGGTRWKRCTVPWTEIWSQTKALIMMMGNGIWFYFVYEAWIMGMRNHEKSVHCIQVARLSALFSCAWNLPFQMQSIPIPSTFWIVKRRQLQSNDDNFYETMTTSMKRWRFYERMTTFMELWRLLESWQLLCNSYIDKTWWNL